MDKLQYDSFYKFIVSVGIILIVAPLFCLHYLISGSYDIIITQEDANNLLPISSDLLNTKMQYIQNILKYLPITCIIIMIVGMGFTVWGCYKWLQIQKTLDRITILDLEEKELHYQKMSAQEIAEKVINEDIESYKDNDSTLPSSYSTSTTTARIRKAFQIEDACYNYLKNKLKRNYNIHQNIKVDKCEYDIVALSKHDNIDLLYEIKYLISASNAKATFNRVIDRIEKHGVTYENITHRNFKFIILIISPENISSETKNYFKSLISQKNLPFVSVEFMNEQQLSPKRVS